MLHNLEKFKSKRILITGGAGFIGEYLIEKLILAGAEISVISRVNMIEHVETFIGDLRDKDFVYNAVFQTKPKYVFHLAAQKSRTSAIDGFYDAIDVNLKGSLNLFSALHKVKSVKSIVSLGTIDEYGIADVPFSEDGPSLPVSAYGFSKLCMTQLSSLFSKQFQLPIVTLRPTLAFGPRQQNDMFLPALINSLLAEKQFKMTRGEQTRDFIYIDDLLYAILLAALTKEAYGKILNIGSGEPRQLADVAQYVARFLHRDGLLKLGDVEYRAGEIMNYSVNISKIKNILGWSPQVTFEEGLKKTIEYYKSIQSHAT